MPYAEIYNHKQELKSMAESPDTNVGIGQSGNQDMGLSARGALGLMAAAAFVAPAAKQVFNKIFSASVNSRLQRKISRGKTAVGIGIATYTLGFTALGVVAVKYAGDIVVEQINEFEIQENDRYVTELKGIRTKQYNAGGDYND